VSLIISDNQGVKKKKLMLVFALWIGVSQSACAFLGGAATGADYEINARGEMNKLDDDYKAERISRAEYQARKSQIGKGSIIY
jgi:hypothetical protein